MQTYSKGGFLPQHGVVKHNIISLFIGAAERMFRRTPFCGHCQEISETFP